jgi:hypothetical protein
MFCKLSAPSRRLQSLLCFSGGLVMAFILARAGAAHRIFIERITRKAARQKTQAATGLEKPRLVAHQPGLF